jgi:hypothetical protein
MKRFMVRPGAHHERSLISPFKNAISFGTRPNAKNKARKTMNHSECLRKAIKESADAYIQTTKLSAYYHSIGESKTVLFKPYDNGTRHGNFLDSTYKAILNSTDWSARLEKPHQRITALPAAEQANAKELDSSTSSDALLMNIFCYPFLSPKDLLAEFGIQAEGDVQFGWPGKVPVSSVKFDKTEIDMRIGNMIFEAKLTEKDFTSQLQYIVESYSDFSAVFDKELLPQSEDEYHGYQLIRNVLAAHNNNYYFTLLADARRPDLIRDFWLVLRAVKDARLRQRCTFLTWQDLSMAAPEELRDFLSLKYSPG